MKALETINVSDNVIVKILPDEGDQECPLENLDPSLEPASRDVIFVDFQRRRSTIADYNPFKCKTEVEAFLKAHSEFEQFNLYKYDHSGVAYSTKSFIGRAHHADWDSGQIGWVLINKEVFPDNKPAEVAESWCKTLTNWANGWYYGYVIEDAAGEPLDSCWSYDDIDFCRSEALEAARGFVK